MGLAASSIGLWWDLPLRADLWGPVSSCDLFSIHMDAVLSGWVAVAGTVPAMVSVCPGCPKAIL